MSAPPHLEEVILTVLRDTNTWTAALSLGIPSPGSILPVEYNGTKLRIAFADQRAEIELSNLFQTGRMLSDTLYIGPFRNAINVGAKEHYFDVKVGQSFIESWRSLKTGKIKRHSEAAYRLTEEIKSLFEFDDLEINPSEDNQTLQIFINGKSYKLSELGSGLTQFILVLATAATQQPSYILIDEPELNLHPSLQLDFLTTLASYARTGILFGTHSIGLARAAADRIYSLRKTESESEVTALEATPRLAEFLGELSFSGYRELGFDRVLLVEGPTDVKTVQQFLRLYKKDHRVVLLPIYGRNLIEASSETIEMQLEEVKRISEHVAALIDSERPAAGAPVAAKRAAFVDACRRAKICCHVLERRAIENYLSDGAVQRVKGEKYQALGPYQAPGDISPMWAKAENWRIAREMTSDELTTTDLGKFLASL
jgi:predicted ATPase